MSWIPAIVACLMEICVSEENRVARLVGVYLLCKSLFDRVFGISDLLMNLKQIISPRKFTGVYHDNVVGNISCLRAYKGSFLYPCQLKLPG